MIAPYGGTLVELVAPETERNELARQATGLFSLQLSPRALCDLELLATGAFSPLDRFMGKAAAERVAAEMRLPDGTLFPIPVTLPVDEANGIEGEEIALRSAKNDPIAWMRVDEVYQWDSRAEAEALLGTTDDRHPLVREMGTWGRFRLSGPLRVMELPRHRDFPALRRTPAEVRAVLAQMGNRNVVAFHTWNPINRADEEFTKRAARKVDGSLLIHAAGGMTKPGEVDDYKRVQACQALVESRYDPRSALLTLLPLATAMAEPRETLRQAIVSRNFGANYLLAGRDFWGRREAREMAARSSEEIGVQVMPYDEMERHEEATRAPGKPRKGFCVWFTGLPGSGKSTLAEVLTVMLMEHGREVTLLDGDVVRTHLSKGLGFSKEDRDTNILRIGFVASEIVRHDGVAVCAAVSPFRQARNRVRAMIRDDAFVEVFVDTPVEICEQRDVKGLYARARAGRIRGFTGVDDPYEPPPAPEIHLAGAGGTPEELAERIRRFLLARGLLAGDRR